MTIQSNSGTTLRQVSCEASAIAALGARSLESGPYPGLVLSVWRGGHTILEEGFGYADLENLIPATPQSVFKICSLSKSFASLIIARLVELGLVDLDIPVGRYLQGYVGPGRDIPVHFLMNHRSGLENYVDLPVFPLGRRGDVSQEQIIASFESAPLVFHPGDAYSYSNSNTHLLGLIAEAVCGMPYAAVLRQFVTCPLQLEDTQLDDLERIIPRRARGYFPTSSGFRNAPEIGGSAWFAAAGIVSTAADIQRYLDGVHRRNLFGDTVRAILYTQDRLNDGTPLQYARGALIIREWEGHRKMAHAGDFVGFSAYMAYYPDDDISIVVLANTRDVLPSVIGLEQKIARILFGAALPEPSNQPLSSEEISLLCGKYLPGPIRTSFERIAVAPQQDGVIAAVPEGPKCDGTTHRLIHVGGRTFLSAIDDEMRFVFSPVEGKADAVTVEWFGRKTCFERGR
ncbi:serine hydrolase domain-containing protein [Sphingosinicella xenopeptidilytica]|uniref:Serine hydrolase domain-containing protein n=1 Tax=Sphingosinicella xenopeptidilytica TaxID=364098 RepID=A0ABW3C4X8_SPHXN